MPRNERRSEPRSGPSKPRPPPNDRWRCRQIHGHSNTDGHGARDRGQNSEDGAPLAPDGGRRPGTSTRVRRRAKKIHHEPRMVTYSWTRRDLTLGKSGGSMTATTTCQSRPSMDRSRRVTPRRKIAVGPGRHIRPSTWNGLATDKGRSSRQRNDPRSGPGIAMPGTSPSPSDPMVVVTQARTGETTRHLWAIVQSFVTAGGLAARRRRFDVCTMVKLR